MKELYRKGLASHSDPESCGDVREDIVEALTGAHASRVSSCEIKYIGSADSVLVDARNIGNSIIGKFILNSPQSKTPCEHGTFLHGNRETSQVAVLETKAVRPEKKQFRNAGMYACEESDISIVPEIHPNNGLKHRRRVRRKGG
jgi:hypothetical protein